jgi:hypothetical protein
MRTKISQPDFLHAIHHDDHMRVADGFSSKRLKELLIAEKYDATYEAICLHKDNLFERFFIDLDDEYDLASLPSIKDPRFEGIKYLRQGNYQHMDDGICLYSVNHSVFLNLRHTGNGVFLSDDHRVFQILPSSALLDKIMMERAIHVGRHKRKYNRANPGPVNTEGFGKGTVWINFSDQRIDLT